ncbi:MAG: addiction module protein [Deltaproteobacteria bacterium]|nr:MAG: addiction module protein [Deltaproteobacteria bacterium]
MSHEEIEKLSFEEKILLVEEVWDSLTESPNQLRLTAGQKEELDSRLKSYKKNPKKTSSWQDVKKRILT